METEIGPCLCIRICEVIKNAFSTMNTLFFISKVSEKICALQLKSGWFWSIIIWNEKNTKMCATFPNT